jgi:transposase
VVFPHLASVVIEQIDTTTGAVLVWVRSRAREVPCPTCGHPAGRVHSRYDRRLADAALAGQTVVVRLRARRFFCDSTECAVRTFAEQPDGVATRHARRTPLCRGMLESIALALIGRPGARLATVLGLPVSRNTLLRLLRALPEEPVGEVTALGVDDWAIRRGQTYATILLNLHTHQPIEVLPDREADTLAEWLKAHPEITVITRDRSGAYGEAARRGAPQATQCADRWHLWKNLGEAVEKTVIAHRVCLPEPATTDAPTPEDALVPDKDDAAGEVAAAAQTPEATGIEPAGPATPETPPESPIVVRTRERFAAVETLRAQGLGIREIARELDLDRKTTRRYVQAASVEDLIARTTSRTSLLDDYTPYLHRRWEQGCTDITQLRGELRELGYRGSQRSLYRLLQPVRGRRLTAPPPVAAPTPEPPPAPPKIRHVVGWIMRDPQHLSDKESLRLREVLARCPELDATRRHVGAFAAMIRNLGGDHLTDWMDRVRADNLPALHSFVNGLRHDLAAVTAGLTLPWSNGPTEGAVTRIKALKRKTYGRVSFPLLRKMILHCP